MGCNSPGQACNHDRQYPPFLPPGQSAPLSASVTLQGLTQTAPVGATLLPPGAGYSYSIASASRV